MAVSFIELRDFTAFRKAKLELSPGVNVLVGKNATGKTHLMKALYSVVRAAPKREIAKKLVGVFRPDDDALGRLGHRRPGQRTAFIRVREDSGHYASISISTTKRWVREDVQSAFAATPTVFLPSREGLAMFEGFAATYEKRELSFDETYYDLAKALDVPALKGVLPKALKEIGADLEGALGGKVVQQGPRFYLRGAGGSMLEAPLVSEGMRKLASILRLLQNGELRSTGLLLWDEPEANLNPQLTVLVAQALIRLAANQVQVVLATHDYLLTETLSLMQRHSRGGADVCYFAFHRDSNDAGVQVSSGTALNQLPFNPIRDEYLAHYDRVRGVNRS
jgi:predicted ATPase